MVGEQLPIPGITTGLKAAEDWRREFPLGYAAIVAWAQVDASRPRGYCSMQEYIQRLRSPEYAHLTSSVATPTPYRVNHNLRASLTRLVLSEYPSLPFRIRRSSCDTQRGTYATPVVAR
jgi:hypothetical protein